MTKEKGVNEDVGIKYFKECCKQLDIDVDNIFCCGSSRATTNISNNSRYVFEPTENQLKESHKFVIKYITNENMYLCWIRQQKPKINRFSCLKKDALNALREKQCYFSKYSGSKAYGDTEKVYVFTQEGIEDFLKNEQAKFM